MFTTLARRHFRRCHRRHYFARATSTYRARHDTLRYASMLSPLLLVAWDTVIIDHIVVIYAIEDLRLEIGPLVEDCEDRVG